MRGTVTALVLILTLSLVADERFSPGEDDNLKWEEDTDRAVDKARERYRPILLYFYHEDSMEFCKEAEEEFFKKPVIKTLASKFICIKLKASGKETEDLRKFLKVDEGEGLILLLDCRFKEMDRIDETDELEDLKDMMKEVLKEHKKIEKKLKTVDKYVEYAENALKRGRMREYVRALEELVALKKKLDIEDMRIEEAAKKISEMEKDGNRLLDEAERLTAEAERWFRARGTSGFRQDLVNQAHQKLAEASTKYPLSSLARRAAEISMRLNRLVAEYQRLKQQEGQQNP